MISIKIFSTTISNIVVTPLDDKGCIIGSEDDILHLTDDFLSYREDDDFIILSREKAKQLADYIYKIIGE